TLWTQAAAGPQMQRLLPRLEFKINYVQPVRALPASLNLEDLSLGEEKSADCMVWSSTRAQFSLEAYETNHDPCFSCSCKPLTHGACREIAQGWQGNVRVLSGYKVHIAVKEKVSDKVQMDLGPFSRRIALKSDPGILEGTILVSGNVRGDVVIGAPEDDGKIK